MQIRVQGIVLDSFRFKESAFVCKIFTSEYGIVSLLLNSVGKKNSSISQVHIQPLNKMEFIVYMKDNKGILKVKEFQLQKSLLGVVPDMKKYALSMFISELVLRTFREMEADERLNLLLEETIEIMGQEKLKIQDLHLYFLIQYSDILGFSLSLSDLLLDVNYQKQSQFVQETISELLAMEHYQSLGINKVARNSILKFLMQYLENHIEIPKIKSMQILEEVLA